MRTIVICDFLRPNGAGLMAINQAKCLSSFSQTKILSLAAPGASVRDSLGNLDSSSYTFNEAFFDFPLSSRSTSRVLVDAFDWLLREIRDFGPDFLFLHNVGRFISHDQLAFLTRLWPTIFTMHDEWLYSDSHYQLNVDGEIEYSFEPHSERNPLIHDYLSLLNFPTQVDSFLAIAPSMWIRERLRQTWPSIRSIHLPNPIDLSEFKPVDRQVARERLGLSSSAQIVGFVGSPSNKRKNFRLVSRALASDQLKDVLIAVLAPGPGFRGFVASDFVVPGGQLDRKLPAPNAGTWQLGKIRSNVLITGDLPRREAKYFYNAVDLIVHPSFGENFPTVPLESNLCGVQCLASNVGGTSETVNSKEDLFDADVSPLGLRNLIHDRLGRTKIDTPATVQARAEGSHGLSFKAYTDSLRRIVEGNITEPL